MTTPAKPERGGLLRAGQTRHGLRSARGSFRRATRLDGDPASFRVLPFFSAQSGGKPKETEEREKPGPGGSNAVFWLTHPAPIAGDPPAFIRGQRMEKDHLSPRAF